MGVTSGFHAAGARWGRSPPRSARRFGQRIGPVQAAEIGLVPGARADRERVINPALTVNPAKLAGFGAE
jgi:hypothetical protein